MGKKEESDTAIHQQDLEITEVKKQNMLLQQRLDNLEQMINMKVGSLMQRQKDIDDREALVVKQEADLHEYFPQLGDDAEFQRENATLANLMTQNREFAESLEKLKQMAEEEGRRLDLLNQEDRQRQEQLSKEIERKTLLLQQKEREIEELKLNKSQSNSQNLSMKSKNNLAQKDLKTGLKMKTPSKHSGLGSIGYTNSWLESDEDSAVSSARQIGQDSAALQHVKELPHSSLDQKSQPTENNTKNAHHPKQSNSSNKDQSKSVDDRYGTSSHDSALRSDAYSNKRGGGHTKPQKGWKTQADTKLEYYKKDPIAEDTNEHAGDYNDKYRSIQYYDDYHKIYKSNVKRRFEGIDEGQFVPKGQTVVERFEEPEYEDNRAGKGQKKRRNKKNKEFFDCDFYDTPQEKKKPEDNKRQPSSSSKVQRPSIAENIKHETKRTFVFNKWETTAEYSSKDKRGNNYIEKDRTWNSREGTYHRKEQGKYARRDLDNLTHKDQIKKHSKDSDFVVKNKADPGVSEEETAFPNSKLNEIEDTLKSNQNMSDTVGKNESVLYAEELEEQFQKGPDIEEDHDPTSEVKSKPKKKKKNKGKQEKIDLTMMSSIFRR